MIEGSRSFCVFWLLGQVCHNRNFKRYGGPDAGLGKLKLLRLQLGVLEFGIIHVGRRMALFSTPFDMMSLQSRLEEALAHDPELPTPSANMRR